MGLSGDLRWGILDMLAISLNATPHDQFLAKGQGPPSDSGNASFRKIIAGVIFSREFILSYPLVLLVLLALFSIRHWASSLQVQRRRRHITALSRPRRARSPTKDHYQGSSSSSSTLIDSSSTTKADSPGGASERTSLLKPGNNSPKPWHMSYQIRAFLVYQPRPIPFINKTLPSNGATLAILAFVGLQVFYVFYRMPLSVPTMFVFADRTSLLFVANLPLLYLFAAKNQPIKLMTGYSYESLNVLHRRLGEVMCLLALLHSAGMIGVWYTLLRPTGFSLVKFLLSKIILLGIGAIIAYELIYFTSLGSFRQRWYELFLALHVSLQAVALVLVWFHHHNSRPYVGAALAIFFIDRLLYRMALKSHASQASLEVCKDGRTVIVRTKIVLTQNWKTPSYIIGAGITSGWKATEHVFLTIPALSRKHITQAHPFTIASRAPHYGDSEGDLKLIIRAQDGFSNDLLNYSKGHTSVKVRLDGPYGSQNALNLLRHSDLSIIVAGGSGIAVALPLVWALQASHSLDLEQTTRKGFTSRIALIWVTRRESHASWVEQTELRNLQEHGVEVIMPPPTATNGHPDVPMMVTSWISAHDDILFNSHAKVGVVCSGPDGMNRVVRNTCSSLLAQGRNVDIEVEKFGW